MNRHRVVIGFDNSESGAALVEYVLLFSLIVMVCLASVTAFGGGVSENVDGSASRITAAGGGNSTP